jgi:hypothetical protein
MYLRRLPPNFEILTAIKCRYILQCGASGKNIIKYSVINLKMERLTDGDKYNSG